jgi:hypothetical protein
MTKKPYLLFLYLSFVLLFLVAACSKNVNYLNITSLDSDSGFAVRNWYILLQENYSKVVTDSLTDSDYQTFKELSKSGNSIPVHQGEDYLNLSEVLQTESSSSCYAWGYIHANEEKTVAFTMGIDNDAKVWINDSLYFAGHSGNITKNEIIFNVNLKKGNNRVVIRISSPIDAYGFYLNIVSRGTINKNWLGKNFFSISEHYLVPVKKTFDVNIQNPCYDTTQPAYIQILNTKKETIIEKKINNGRSWRIAADSLKPGPYLCKLITKDLHYEQPLFYGDYRKFLNDLKTTFAQLPVKEDIQLNLETLFSRLNYLDETGRNSGYEQTLERKMSGLLFELERIKNALQQHNDPFKNSEGYHIMSYKSAIDGVTNHYAVYVPGNVNPHSPIPTIVIIPWVAKQNPFTESWHLAFIDRIEYLEHLAQQYKCAVMWQSARVYEHYNFNPIVNKAIFESIRDLQKYYPLDTNRMYAFGTCSGGTQTLLLTGRHPSMFAAAAVEGPPISYLESDRYPQSWVQQNNIVTSAQNFGNLPLFIANSTNDWHGGKEPEIGNFMKALKSAGAPFEFESMGNPTVTNFVKMRDDNVITDKIFSFLTKQRRTVPSHIKFSTAQLKYNQSYWISIDGKIKDTLATIDARIDSNKISLFTENVRSFTIYPNELPGNTFHTLNIYLGNKYFQTINIDPANNKYAFQIGTAAGKLQKNHYTEGPINDFFSDKFFLVKRADNLFTAPIDNFVSNWQYNFFGSCYSKPESNITYEELKSNNILFFGKTSSNKYIKNMLDAIPLTICGDTIKLFNKSWVGKNLTAKIIYPNPLNPQKYFLVIAGTNHIYTGEIIDLPLKGWNDVEITNDSSKLIYAKDFDQHWKP